MSHFSVLVIGKDIESLLAPYDENESMEEYIDMRYEDVIKEFNDFYNKTLERKSKDMELGSFEIKTLVHGPIKSIEKPVPQWLKNWWNDWCGRGLDEDGNSLSVYNKDSKWDWYQIGGRWAGLLPLKEGVTSGEIGGRSWVFGNEDPYEDGRVDSALVKDVDFELLKEDEKNRCENHWYELKYSNEPFLKTQYDELVKKYKTLENYIEKCGHFSTYAVVDENGWYSKGDMGWWGMSSETQDESDAFDASFYDRFIKNLDPEERITIVDCHI
ncbi:MAG: hypothetical protein AMQ22_00593 [Candidatus Methanofastidiosum methylothiophilum]|uniref:Uncharacterized protein n=1 Tax=Candidatus Methanofastidiosum methylothiophilum TaxID=1705564 RepID=A0A150J6D0_9EURY|nr:MAG: hypothetical protein AMQ22_00593 [Candidatus Methanofastidiosum methylthiophilus]